MTNPPVFNTARRWFAALLLCMTNVAWSQETTPSQAKTRERPGRSKLKSAPALPAETAKVKSESETEAKDSATNVSRGFLGDPKKFTRLSGWGSMGGAMGQFGIAKSMLIMLPPVQEELKLTEKQKEELVRWSKDMQKRGESFGRSMREQGGDPMQQGDMPIAARIVQFTSMMSKVSEMLKENENGFSRILTPNQRKRLNQISLQMEGIGALAKPEVAEVMNLTPDQEEAISLVLTRSRIGQMTTWIEQGQALASLRNRRSATETGKPSNSTPGEEPSDASPKPPDKEPSKEATPPAPGTSADKARIEREKAFRKQFETMREKADSVQDQMVRDLTKILTRRQRANFEKLLGPPFDPSKINTLGRPPGRDARLQESEK